MLPNYQPSAPIMNEPKYVLYEEISIKDNNINETNRIHKINGNISHYDVYKNENSTHILFPNTPRSELLPKLYYQKQNNNENKGFFERFFCCFC